MLKDFDISTIIDFESARKFIRKLLNLIEKYHQEIRELKRLNQQLRDENHRLKGEQGKPRIKPSTKAGGKKNFSSEEERKRRKKRNKKAKKDRIKTHNSQVCKVDPAVLPEDARFKGYQPVVVQDVIFKAHNTLFLKEKYYSPSLNKTYLAPLPPGYDGEFGPGIKALVPKLYYDSNITEGKIFNLLQDADVHISAGKISNLLIKNHETFHAEKNALYEAGLNSTPWQNIDDTSTRVNGQNQFCHILCNPFYTAYFTSPRKDRLTVLDVLKNFAPRTFVLNEEAFGYIDIFKLPKAVVQQLRTLPLDQTFNEPDFLNLLDRRLPQLGPQQRSHILDAAAIAAYNATMELPIVKVLLCDNAPQFKLITQQLSLCWVHDGRHYKKLDPFISHHRKLLEAFLKTYWDYYRQLLEYRQAPSDSERIRLDSLFDEIFSSTTGYEDLDHRIAKTKAKKQFLLLVLDHPELPLHNNDAELSARGRVRKRVVSFGTRVPDGTKAWDTFTSLSATTRKLGINFFDYLYDRITGTGQIPNLADIITQRAAAMNLGASWGQGP
ncbi:MAG: bZIP transcription factor [Thermodesulfobacteriota bacterium]